MRKAVAAWDDLAELVEYPAGRPPDELAATVAAADGEDVVAPLERFRRSVETIGLRSIQESYVDAFDLDPACTLNIGWHLFGDAPKRGALLAALREDLARAGVPERGELPDHLASLLRLMPRADEATASEVVALIAPALDRILDRLRAQTNPYADVVEAVRRVLAASIGNEALP